MQRQWGALLLLRFVDAVLCGTSLALGLRCCSSRSRRRCVGSICAAALAAAAAHSGVAVSKLRKSHAFFSTSTHRSQRIDCVCVPYACAYVCAYACVCVCALAICNALRVVRSKSANNNNNNRANKASALFLLNRIADAHEN